MSQSKKHITFTSSELISENPIEEIVTNIINFSEENEDLLGKYSEQFFVKYFDRLTIQKALVKLDNQNQKELKLEKFIRAFLSIIEHCPDETLYLAMSLRRLFLKIKEETNNETGIKFSDFTNYLCDKIADDDPELVVPLKQVPAERHQPDLSRVREIDIHPTTISKGEEMELPKIARDKKKKDRKLVEKKPVSKFIYNGSRGEIITIGRLSSSIYFYSTELQKLRRIQPKPFKDMTKEIAILSIAFNEKVERIGVIINGIGIAFWEGADNYETQKTISRYYGERIFYLKLFNEWITSDKTTIYFWDLKEENVTRRIEQRESVAISDVCEINHLRCLCVSYVMKGDRKLFMVYNREFKPIVHYDLGAAGAHSLHYNLSSQMVVAAGYHSKLAVFEVENGTYSVSLKKQLLGHSSIVTCVSEIAGTNFVLSGDDMGEVRIWELNYMKCVQVVKVAKWVGQVLCSGQKLVFSDSRLNVMQMDRFSPDLVSEDLEVLYSFHNDEKETQVLVTRKGVRQLDLQSGTVDKIFVTCDHQEELTAAVRISSGILVGTSRGQMKLLSVDSFREKWSVYAHEGEILQVAYDRKTRFIFSLGSDSRLKIWPEKAVGSEGAKKVISFRGKSFNLMTLFNEVRVIILGSTDDKEIALWDYEMVRLLTVITVPSPIVTINFDPVCRILMTTNFNDEVALMKLGWESLSVTYEMLYYGDSRFSGLKKPSVHTSLQNSEKGIGNTEADQNGAKAILSKAFLDKQNTQAFITSTNLTKKDLGKKVQLTRKKIDNTTTQRKIKMQEPDQSHSHPHKFLKLPDEETAKPQKVPSITYIPDPSSNPSQHSQKREESNLHTLKTLKNIPNQITSHISIQHRTTCDSVGKSGDAQSFLVLGNNKGSVFCFNIDSLLRDHIEQPYRPINKRESPHMYRPAKQSHSHELEKGRVSCLNLRQIKRLSVVKKIYFRPLWESEIKSQEQMTCLSLISMKQTYLCSLFGDGSMKLFDLNSGKVEGSLLLNQPLPICWDICIEKDSFVRKNFYETLLVLDQILTNEGFEMMAKEYRSINVSEFLDKLNSKIRAKRQSGKAPKRAVLQDQYAPEDFSKSFQKESTLKSLEAYKRVKTIKEQMESKKKTTEQDEQNGHIMPQSLQRQKEEIQAFLSPHYFPRLAEQGVSNKLYKSVEVGSLQERSLLLLERVEEKKKLYKGEPLPKAKKLEKKALSELPSILNYSLQAAKEAASQKPLSRLLKLNTSVSNINLMSSSNIAHPTLKALKSLENVKPTSFAHLKSEDTKRNETITKKNEMSKQPLNQILKGINEKLRECKKAAHSRRSMF